MSDPIKQREITPHLALLAVQIFFGSLPVIGKPVLAILPAMSLVGFRVGITAAILFLVQAYRKRLWLVQRGDYARLAVLSLFGITFNQMFFIGGLAKTSAANTSLLAVTIPIFAIAIGAILGTERLRTIKVFGIICAAIGVVILIDPRNASFSSETTIGDLFIIINSLSFGIYVATSKEIITRNGPFRSMMWVFIFGSLICVPVGLFSLSSVDVTAIPWYIWAVVVYIAVGATAAPYLLNAYALQKVKASTLAVYIYFQPLIGFLLAVIFLNEQIDAAFVAAALMVFLGVFLATKRFTAAEPEPGRKTEE